MDLDPGDGISCDPITEAAMSTLQQKLPTYIVNCFLAAGYYYGGDR